MGSVMYRGRIVDKIQIKVFRVFLLVIQSHLSVQLCLEIYIFFKLTQPITYFFKLKQPLTYLSKVTVQYTVKEK